MTRLACLLPLALCACGSGSNDDDDGGGGGGGGDDTVQTPDGETLTFDGGIDCAWLEGDNCWRRAMTDLAETCTPPDEIGVLDVSGTSCRFSDGTLVSFAIGLDVDAEELPDDWDFTVTRPDSTTCRVLLDDERYAITVEGETTQQVQDALTFAIECPDGTAYGPGGLDLLECGLDNLPGYYTSGGAGFYSLGFLGDGGFTMSCAVP
mgnify:CR=1 FL=1